MKKRNAILSFVLSFFISGLGQIYNGELKKGVIYLVIIFPLLLLLGFTLVFSDLWGFIAFFLIIILYKLLICIEAFRTSKKLGDYALKPINKTWKYIIFIVFAYIVTWYGTQLNRKILGYETFNIPTSSMEPSIYAGDNIMATRINPKNIKLGDIVVFNREDGQKYLSRVVGLPNHEIQIIDDKVSINNSFEQWTKTKKSIDIDCEFQEYHSKLSTGRTYQIKKIVKYGRNLFLSPKLSNTEQMIIPANHLFVLGDNRNNSMDSRFYGTIPFENIEKKVNYIWWSSDKKRIGTYLD